LVLASLPITRANADQVDFSEPYFTVRYALLVKPEHAGDWDATGKPVALVKGPILSETVNVPAANMDLRPTDSYATALKMLDADTVAGVMGHDLALRDIEERRSM